MCDKPVFSFMFAMLNSGDYFNVFTLTSTAKLSLSIISLLVCE